MNRERYVLGFLFNEDMTQVLLQIKNRPMWQKGSVNGIGGKIEDNESIDDAMRRECQEETGLTIHDWNETRLTIMGAGYLIYVYSYCTHLIKDVEQMTDETVFEWEVDSINDLNLVQGVSWMIPLLIEMNKKPADEVMVAISSRIGK